MKENKIKPQREAIRLTRALKKRGKKIVACSGAFDILHIDHIKFLKEAKARGDFLIVLLNSDRSIRSYKGSRRPLNPQRERAAVVAALEFVDALTIFNELTPIKLLAQIKPHIFYQGSDWGKDCPEREVVERYGGKIAVSPRKGGVTTTQIIERVLKASLAPLSKSKAVFLDRGGTLDTDEPPYLHKIEDYKFIPGVIPALQKLSKTDHKIIIVTDQSGIGRGYFTEQDLKKLHLWLLETLRKRGVRIDRIYYCPHHPRDNCSCRKPKIALLLKAQQEFNIDFKRSYFIGDRMRDILAGNRAGCKTILVKTGKEESDNLPRGKPDLITKDLPEAISRILS